MPGGDAGGWWDPSHVVVHDGMRLQSYRDPAHANPSNPNGYVSGGVSSSRALRQQNGKYLIRFRMDAGRGIGHVLLMMPSGEGWPPEIDFSEDGAVSSSVRNHTAATLHCGSGGSDSCRVQSSLGGIDLTVWHTMGMEWTPASVVYSLDGVPWAKVTSSQAAIPAPPMELDIQAQAGDCSTETPCPDATTPAHVNLQVDWVAAYKPAP